MQNQTNLTANKEHIHKWEIDSDQSDTGTHGIRLICRVKHYARMTHCMTIHRDLLEKYI